MTEMVEKVARAICKEQGALPGVYPAYYPAARAAISALMEPTQKMIAAVMTKTPAEVTPETMDDLELVLRDYQAMLKAALND